MIFSKRRPARANRRQETLSPRAFQTLNTWVQIRRVFRDVAKTPEPVGGSRGYIVRIGAMHVAVPGERARRVG
jgi:hypothetical protein